VLLSIRYLHLTYEAYVREAYQREFTSIMRTVIEEEIHSTKNLRVFIEEAKKIFVDLGKGEQESYLTFQRIGIKTIYKRLDTSEVGERLESANRIEVMKTWFPDHQDIEGGLRKALERSGTEVKLLLCHPDSPALQLRSPSAGFDKEYGSRMVKRTLTDLLGGAQGTFKIALHKEWPGCPVIWYGEDKLQHVLLGFYFIGKSSPFWPWIEISAGSELDGILRRQFDALWDRASERISNKEELAKWLNVRGWLEAKNPAD